MAETVLDYRPAAEVEAPPALLTRHLPAIEAALRRSSLPARSQLGRMAAYHMGWAEADGSPSRTTSAWLSAESSIGTSAWLSLGTPRDGTLSTF